MGGELAQSPGNESASTLADLQNTLAAEVTRIPYQTWGRHLADRAIRRPPVHGSSGKMPEARGKSVAIRGVWADADFTVSHGPLACPKK